MNAASSGYTSGEDPLWELYRACGIEIPGERERLAKLDAIDWSGATVRLYSHGGDLLANVPDEFTNVTRVTWSVDDWRDYAIPPVNDRRQ